MAVRRVAVRHLGRQRAVCGVWAGNVWGSWGGGAAGTVGQLGQWGAAGGSGKVGWAGVADAAEGPFPIRPRLCGVGLGVGGLYVAGVCGCRWHANRALP